MTAARQIRASNGSREQYISHKGHALPPLKQHHAAGTVTRTMQDLEPQLTEIQWLALFEKEIRLRGFDLEIQAEIPRLRETQ